MSRPNLDDADPGRPECGNCGETDKLLRCSRCRTAWYCCRACQKSHWPFHREACRHNAFADAIEDSEPKFASWLRRHGKQAALRDGDIERLEHASQAACSPVSRQELMASMWGKADPSPAGPRWTREDERKMAAAVGLRLLEREKENAGLGARGRAALRAWMSSPDALPPPVARSQEEEGGGGGGEEKQQQQQQQQLLGRECGSSLWRWWQTPTRVEVVVNLFEVRRELRRSRERLLLASTSPSPQSSSSPSPWRRGRGGKSRRGVEVSIGPRRLSVALPASSSGAVAAAGAGKNGEGGAEEKVELLSGALFKKVAVDGSTWHSSDGLLFVSLLKLSRRGCCLDGDTVAETWWRSVFEEEEAGAGEEAGEERGEKAGEEEERGEKAEEVEGEEARPTTTTTTTTKVLASSSPSPFLKLPEPLPASAPLCYFSLPRDPDDEGGSAVGAAERVATRKRK